MMELERHTLVGLPLSLDYIRRFYSQPKFGVAVTALAWLLYAMSFYYSDGTIKRTSSDGKFEDNKTTGGSLLLTLVITLVTGPYLVIHLAKRNRRQIFGSGYPEPKADLSRLKPEDGTLNFENRFENRTLENSPLRQQLQIGSNKLVAAVNDPNTVTLDSTVQNQDSSNLLKCSCSPTDNTSTVRKETADMSSQTIAMQSLEKVDSSAMTDVPMRESKAVNTPHKLLTHTTSVGTETTGPYKKKLRRAQKLLNEALGKAKKEKRANLEKWRRIMTKYRDKLMKLMKATEEKGTLVAYVRTTNQASEKVIQGEAIALSDLKWKLQYQCKLNEKFSEDLRSKRAIVNSLNQIIKPECEK